MKLHRCWAEIDISALLHNLAVARWQSGGAEIMAIIKADGYGHGLEPIAAALAAEVAIFGVATADEAQRVRANAPDAEIVLLSPALPEERRAVVAARFIPCVSTVEEARAYSQIAAANREPFAVHLKIDTGMGRIGIWKENALSEIALIARLPNLRIDGIATHLPVPDEDAAFTNRQLLAFSELVSELAAIGIHAPRIHCLNSAGIIGFPQFAHTLVRPGLMLYGSSPISEFQKNLRPVMTLKTRITLIREVGAQRSISYGRTYITNRPTRVATLAIGYGDGYPRHLSNQNADVLIRGKRCPLLGRVTMDQLLVDVSAQPDAAISDEVTLIGRSGDEEILASELAQKASTIAWEIFTGIHGRVARTYLPANAPANRERALR